MRHFNIIIRIIIAAILFQTLFFKFSGAPESKYIFAQLGVEPFGRWFAGISELFAVILLLIPATQAVGAVFSIGIISGALLSHIFVLGIDVQGDGGLLFGLALVVFFLSSILAFRCRSDLTRYINIVVKKYSNDLTHNNNLG